MLRKICYLKSKASQKVHLVANILTFVVIHFISTPEKARKDLPRFLNNEKPTKSSDDGVGSQDYSRQPEAILLGLGYYNEIVEDLRQACRGTVRGVPWVRGGLSKSEFNDLMANSPPAPMAQQGPVTAGKIKKKLLQLLDDGEGSKDGLFEW
jgi:hypothetical protein